MKAYRLPLIFRNGAGYVELAPVSAEVIELTLKRPKGRRVSVVVSISQLRRGVELLEAQRAAQAEQVRSVIQEAEKVRSAGRSRKGRRT